MYAITATVTITYPGLGTTTRQVPTFYLDENVQGIRSWEHAAEIASDILMSATRGTDLDVEVAITAVYIGSTN